MTPEDAAAHFGRIAHSLENAGHRVVEEALEEALAHARDLSQGHFTLAALRRMRHPYRHGGSPPQDPAIINRQSGRFAAAWHPVWVSATHAKAANYSPEAEWLEKGTARMIARPIVQRVEEATQPKFEQLAEAALKDLLGD